MLQAYTHITFGYNLGRQHAYAARSDILQANYWENKHCEKYTLQLKAKV